ncbi:TonB family protein [Povalibacter uvarum]|uniref:TonB family protein n=1 Tax=Povalibacter uvarum TaxID=732238 RepID=A0A841HSE9_9GAMM|nr:energy transducer TonB [Povalibacter uvarum]MBB6096311.1 TonB family protein [Povalibacter uvarum]
MKESDAVPDAQTGSRPDAPPTYRLVIRAEIIPEPPSPTRDRRSLARKRTAALAISAVALLALGWAGIRVFRSEEARDLKSPLSASRSDPSDVSPVVRAVQAPAASAEKASPTVATSIEPRSIQAHQTQLPARDVENASPSPIDEVMPDVPRSALETIRGTVRVSVRAAVDPLGTVVTVTPVDSGPSRYFERLAVDASRKWTFAAAPTKEQRTVVLRFAFTRNGVTAESGG